MPRHSCKECTLTALRWYNVPQSFCILSMLRQVGCELGCGARFQPISRYWKCPAIYGEIAIVVSQERVAGNGSIV